MRKTFFTLFVLFLAFCWSAAYTAKIETTAGGPAGKAADYIPKIATGLAQSKSLDHSSSNFSVNHPYDLIRSTSAATGTSLKQAPWLPELLEYEVQWGLLSVGWADLRTTQIDDFGRSPSIRIVSQSTSNHFCDSFYKVRDLNESWIKIPEFHSLGYLKHLEEGNFYRNEWVLYDYPQKAYLSKTTNKDGSYYFKEGSIPGPVQDILSSLYFLRQQPLRVGDTVVLDANTKDNWPLNVKVLYRTRVEVPAGEFQTVVVEPFLRQEGIFVQKGRSLRVWMTDDPRHIPVYMSVEIFFGHVSAKLLRINGKANPRPDFSN